MRALQVLALAQQQQGPLPPVPLPYRDPHRPLVCLDRPLPGLLRTLIHQPEGQEVRFRNRTCP